jgi:hypothetical protein
MSKEKNVANTIVFDVKQIINASRQNAAREINSAMTGCYFQIGKMIVEDEQNSEEGVLEDTMTQLSQKLNEKFGKNYSVDNLERFRKFYLVYQDRILTPLELENPFKLAWSHYVLLLNITNKDERDFYEIEAVNNNWSLVELQRQYSSSLFERLSSKS